MILQECHFDVSLTFRTEFGGSLSSHLTFQIGPSIRALFDMGSSPTTLSSSSSSKGSCHTWPLTMSPPLTSSVTCLSLASWFPTASSKLSVGSAMSPSANAAASSSACFFCAVFSLSGRRRPPTRKGLVKASIREVTFVAPRPLTFDNDLADLREIASNDYTDR